MGGQPHAACRETLHPHPGPPPSQGEGTLCTNSTWSDLGVAEGIDGGHQRWCAAEEVRHFHRFLDFRLCRTGGASAVGNIRYTIGVRHDGVHDHSHEMLVLRWDG